MLALQTMRARAEPEAPLSNITNHASAMIRTPQTFDAISSQILGLTSIATNLQREMAQLSRRSKDNATDLISLKDATNARDEDIRKSLKDLVSGLDNRFLSVAETSRSRSDLGLYLDSKAHNGSPSVKAFSLPRIPSPASFSAAMEREITASPSMVSSDGAASIALLEKVLREMGTKDGQDKILKTLESVKSQSLVSPTAIDPIMMKKLEEILSFMKENLDNRALVRSIRVGGVGAQSQLEMDISSPQSSQLVKGCTTDSANHGKPANFVSDEIMNMLKRVKESISAGGGLTNEVKALVRELRGEVLGMGREIARKLEQTEASRKASMNDAPPATPEEVSQIVDEGLAELRQHMDELVREQRRQSAASTKSSVDPQEVYLAVKSAFAEFPRPREEPLRDLELEREQMLQAVKEAWEDCKPDIALEHFGLERDEILETLKEGLKSYQPQQPETIREVGASYEEVLEAVQKALAHFQPPSIHTPESITREEILVTVRECLESFEFPMPIPATSAIRELELTRDDVLDAIKNGMSAQPPVAKEIEFNREDLFDAVRAGLEGAPAPLGDVGAQVLEQMHEFLASMKQEFQQYSAANGKDTEQVLDALKDGIEDLRANIESYVDRAADVTGKDEIIDTVKDGFRTMQVDLEKGLASHGKNRGSPDTPELLDAMEKEFEHLRETITKSLARTSGSSDKEEILDAIQDISESGRHLDLSSNAEDNVRLVKEELEHMRNTIVGTLIRSGSIIDREEVLDAVREGLEASRIPEKPYGAIIDRDEVLDAIREGLEKSHMPPKQESNESILSNTSELLDAFQEGVDGIRSDMGKLLNRPVDLSTSYEILDTLKDGLVSVRSDIERLHESQRDLSETATARGQEVIVHDENLISTEIEGLKVMITQLRIKVEALDIMPTPPEPVPTEHHFHKDDLNDVHAAIQDLHRSVNNFKITQETSSNDKAATKDDTDAIETLLRNLKAQLDDSSFPIPDSMARSAQVDILEDLVKEIKEIVEDSAVKAEQQSVKKEDFGVVERLLEGVAFAIEEIQAKLKDSSPEEEHVTKTDIHAIESLCLDTKTQIDELVLPDVEKLPTTDDIGAIHDAIKTFQEQIEAENELTAQAFEARKIEHGGLASKIDDVRGILNELKDEFLGKLNGSEEGLTELRRVLGHHHESMDAYATASNLKELVELVNGEFERHHASHEATKLETEGRDAAVLVKHDETRAAVSSELSAKIEDKFNELIIKYDNAQLTNDAKLNAMDGRDSQNLEVMTSTKAVVDDLKLLIDMLGTTMTESCDRMSEDAKTVFNRVDEANTKLDDLHAASAHEHGLTRGEIAKTLTAAMRLEGNLFEHQPAMMAVIKEVLAVVTQQYEHSQQQTESFARATEEIKSGVNAIPSAIPPLLPALPPAPITPPLTLEVPVHKQYDDSQVHDKLNVLLNHANGAKEAFTNMESHASSTKDSLANLEKIDKMHELMIATAEEVSAMVATQTRLMAEHHDSRATEAAEAGVALEKRNAQKEKVEVEILSLNEEKDALLHAVATLKTEREDLGGHCKQLTREVAKLETALNLRQEEMRDMEARAEQLERRILEGVMDHARSRAIPKPPRQRKTTIAERDAAMSLKRVPSSASTLTTNTSIKDGNSALGSAVGLALKKRTPLTSAANSTVSARSSGVDRRILSTSHVTGNRGRAAPDFHTRTLMLAPAPSTGLVSLKRSHSVKNNPSSYNGGRKASWIGTTSEHSASIADKENHAFADQDEVDANVDDEGSDAGTERRTSFSGTSYMYTDSLTNGTRSSLGTATEGKTRTASYTSSINAAIGGTSESIVEEDEEDESTDESASDRGDQGPIQETMQSDESAGAMVLSEPPPTALEAGENNSTAMTAPDELMDGLSDLPRPPKLNTGAMCMYNEASDSGLGTEPPTANLEHGGSGKEYFNMSKQGSATS